MFAFIKFIIEIKSFILHFKILDGWVKKINDCTVAKLDYGGILNFFRKLTLEHLTLNKKCKLHVNRSVRNNYYEILINISPICHHMLRNN